MKHTLKQIIGGKTEMSYVCNGVVYYYITVDKTIYQLELDTKDEVEFKDGKRSLFEVDDKSKLLHK